MRRYIDITDIEIPSDENDYDELVAFADAIARQEIMELPERKKGKWYKPTGMMPPEYAGRYRCSECDGFAMHDWKSHREVLTDFCPNCGADMKGEQK